MFKLFKDLTRPPERLDSTAPASTPAPTTPPISAPSSLGYTARQRTRPPLPAQPNGAQSTPAAGAGAIAVEEIEETEEDAKKVVQLLRSMDDADGVMAVVEVSLCPLEKSWTDE
jgi:hypothetical protein